MINVLIADDVNLLRDCLKLTIECNEDMVVVGMASNGSEAIEMAREKQPDVILMDIVMPIVNGIEAIKVIKSEFKSIKILVLTSLGDEDNITKAVEHGADGYVLKDIGGEELILSIRSVFNGLTFVHRDAYSNGKIEKKENKKISVGKTEFDINGFKVELTARETGVLELIAQGLTNDEIGEELNISEGRVRNIITELISKLILKNRTQLAVFAVKNLL